jgi:hypothetical protein
MGRRRVSPSSCALGSPGSERGSRAYPSFVRRHLAVALAVSLALAAVAATALESHGSRAAASGPPSFGGVGWHPHMKSAERYAKGRDGDVSFAVIDLDGRMRGYQTAGTAPAASVFKVMLLATYLRQDSVRHRGLNSSDRSLLGPMIRRSDNVAATRVRDIVGRSAIERLARDAHMRDFHYEQVWGLSRTSARDQVRFMYRLRRYIPRRHWRYAKRLLSSIIPPQRWGIGKVRPRGWHLYFKGGWGSGTGRVDHQVALLTRHRYRVAVAILTEFDPSHDYGKETLKGVAKRLLRGLPRLPSGF